MSNKQSKNIVKLEFNKLAFELFEKLLQDDDNYRTIRFFQICGSNGVGKSSLLNFFKGEALNHRKTVKVINNPNEINQQFYPASDCDFILIDNVDNWEEIELISNSFNKSKIIFTSDEDDVIGNKSLVVQAYLSEPTIEEYSQIIKTLSDDMNLDLHNNSYIILAYLTQKTRNGLHTIFKTFSKIKTGDSDDRIRRKFEDNVSLGSNRLRNNFIND